MNAVTLAQIRLNAESRAVQRDLRDATQMHRTVMRLIPEGLGDQPRLQAGLLYRLDLTSEAATLLVQVSGSTMDAARGLPRDYGKVTVKDLSPMFTALCSGMAVRYRIAANAAKRERLPLEERGKRGAMVPVTGTEADHGGPAERPRPDSSWSPLCPVRSNPRAGAGRGRGCDTASPASRAQQLSPTSNC